MKILNLMYLFLLVSFVSQAQIFLPGGINSIGNHADKIVIGTNNPYWKPGGIELSGNMILLSNATGNVHSWFPFEDGNVYISGDAENGSGEIVFRKGSAFGQYTDYMRIKNNGNVGIGTANPGEKLTVNGNALIDGKISTKKTTNTTFQVATHDWSGSHGLLFNSYFNHSGNGAMAAANNTFYANNAGQWSGGAGAIMFYGNGGQMDIMISPESTGADNAINWGDPKMRILRNGKVGIGTTVFDAAQTANGEAYRLYVKGGIKVEEVKVELCANNWCDYVFEDDYVLLSLPEVEAHINTKGYLHNTRSAAEIEAEGLELKDMTINQQEKIEEIFLHLIEMNKRVKALEAENKQLRNTIANR